MRDNHDTAMYASYYFAEEPLNECEHEICEFCGECHQVGCHCFKDACDSYVATCVRCEEVIPAEQEKHAITYPGPEGYVCTTCDKALMKELAQEMASEREAEMRMEEALYGYELPRY